MLTCEICKDLLPVYAAGECSNTTRKAVDEHIKTCSTCRLSLASMMDVIVPAENENSCDNLDEKRKEISFKKGFRKIRRRWALSIVCILLLFPLSGLLILGYNDAKGEGYAYSNLSDLIQIRSFMECLKNKDYEGAFSYIDSEGMYEAMITSTEDSQEINLFDYYQAMIGGSRFYVSGSTSLGSYTNYSKEGMDAQIWADVIRENAEGLGNTPIPKNIFEAAATLAEESSGEDILILDADSELSNGDYTYMECVAIDGESFYVPTRNGRVPGFEWENGANIVPEKIFSIMKADMLDRREKTNAVLDSYRNIGKDEYLRLLKEEFITTFQELEAKGVTIHSYSIGTPKKVSRIMTDMGIPTATDSWYFDINFSLSPDTSLSEEWILLGITDGKIGIRGSGWNSVSSMDQVNYVQNIFPYPYILEEDTDQIIFHFN